MTGADQRTGPTAGVDATRAWSTSWSDRLLAEHDPGGDRHEFMGAQFDLGLAWVHFPEGEGGFGIAPQLQDVVDARARPGRGPATPARST